MILIESLFVTAMQHVTVPSGSRWLQRLAAFEAVPGAAVVSFYVNLDPEPYALPKARLSEVESLADRARQRYTDAEEHRPLELDSAVRQAIERGRAVLEEDFDPAGARAVALFCCMDPDLLRVIRLPRQAGPSIGVDRHPHLRLLLESAVIPEVWALLVNRRVGRILVNRGGMGFEEVQRIEDEDVPGWHDQGGWSQRRYQAHIDDHIHRHVRHVCDALADLSREQDIDYLVLGTTPDVKAVAEGSLEKALMAAVAGRVQVDIEATTPAQLTEEVGGLVDEAVAEQDRRLLESLEMALGRGEGAAGVGPVLEALNLRRVDTMAMASGFTAPGARCPSDGWLDQEVRDCPVDGIRMEPAERLEEEMIRAALGQSAGVRVLDSDLVNGLRAAALLRF
jgi:peptide chain release factor subunit 1